MDDQPGPGPIDRERLGRVLVIVLSLVGVVQTLILTALPFVAGLAQNTGFTALLGAANTVGYLAIAIIATYTPLHRHLVRRVAATVVAVSIVSTALVLAWSDSDTNGTSILVAMSALMAGFILAYTLVGRRPTQSQ